VGGSGSGYRIKPGELDERRREAEDAARQGRLDAEINSLLSEQLIEINQRDREAVADRLEEIQDALKDQIEEFDRLLFGGSVAKQTYVEGLSDVDSLVVLRGEELTDETPADVREEFAQLLRGKLNMGEIREIRTGDLAVTIEYKDGPEIQLLPARERGGELEISSPSGKRWMAIEPRAFASRLSEVNAKQANAVVPAIKLAKAVIGNLPESQRLNGYHAEALAVAAFEDYSGPRSPKAMVTHFFESAASNVTKPVADITGQSSHVDEALGPAMSQDRQRLAAVLRRIASKMGTSTSAEAWRDLLGT
jgi:hypothetical protein